MKGFKSFLKLGLVAAVLGTVLSGCAVYTPDPYYADSPYAYNPAPYAYYPAPSIYFGVYGRGGDWDGGRWHGRHHHWRHRD